MEPSTRRSSRTLKRPSLSSHWEPVMCEYFVKADPILYEQRTRTVRIHSVLTSIRLENTVWDTLAQMAEARRCSTNSLIVQFHDEILAHRGEVPNFASFLRVTCIRFLSRELSQARHAVHDHQDSEFDSLNTDANSLEPIPAAGLHNVPVRTKIVALRAR
jgi:predicted DNA-binding ribbon-helix-helix protein